MSREILQAEQKLKLGHCLSAIEKSKTSTEALHRPFNLRELRRDYEPLKVDNRFMFGMYLIQRGLIRDCEGGEDPEIIAVREKPLKHRQKVRFTYE